MQVTIVGTGAMARAIGTRVLAGGHELTILGKEAQRAAAAAADLSGPRTATAGSIDDTLAGDVIVLAIGFADARTFAQQRGDELAGMVVVDISNPVNESYDGLVVAPDTSAAVELACLAPLARFVKAFNLTAAGPLTAGGVRGHALDVLLAGDDAAAKERVTGLVRDGGLEPIDAGGLDRARELEVAGLLSIRLQTILGTGFSNAFQLIGPR